VDGATQVIPHLPQCASLRWVSTQAPPHAVVPLGQTHSPSVQAAPVGQAFPHLPQCALSLDTQVGAPAHTSTRGAVRHPTSPLNTGTRAGEWASPRLTPLPSCPATPLPQQRSVPSARRAHVWLVPAESCTAPVRPTTATGAALQFNVPSPSSPPLPSPQQRTVVSANRAQV
jgi:hypothetical protein